MRRISVLLVVPILLLAVSARAQTQETFESPGTDLPYEWVTLEPDNVLDPDFPTSLLGSPPGWGAQALCVNIGGTSAGAQLKRKIPVNRTGLYTHASVIISHDGMAEGKGESVLVAKPDVDGDHAAWALLLVRHEGALYWALTASDFRRWIFVLDEPIQIGTPYDHWIACDFREGFLSWSINNRQVTLEALPARYPDNIAFLTIGACSAQTGRNLTYFVDNVFWQELEP